MHTQPLSLYLKVAYPRDRILQLKQKVNWQNITKCRFIILKNNITGGVFDLSHTQRPRLGVQKRRIYDITVVFNSVGFNRKQPKCNFQFVLVLYKFVWYYILETQNKFSLQNILKTKNTLKPFKFNLTFI